MKSINKKTKEMNLQLFMYLMFIPFDIFLNEIKSHPHGIPLMVIE